MDANDISNLIDRTRTYYDSIGRVWCPVLNSFVYFGAEGARHMLYKANRKKRPVAEQKFKMALLRPGIRVLKNMDSEIMTWRLNDDSELDYIAVIANVPDPSRKLNIIRVIVKRTSDGQFNYHSAMRHDH